MGRKQNIWQNIDTNAHNGGYKRTKQTSQKSLLLPKIVRVNTDNTVSLLNA